MGSELNSDPIVIIGGGHNGLIAAFYLAEAGAKPLVLEGTDHVGGGAITTEIGQGFRVPALSHEVVLHDQIFTEMNLRAHGVELISPDADVCAIAPDGSPLVLWNDSGRTAEALRMRHQHDGDAFLKYRESIDRAATVLADVLMSPPADIDSPSMSDAWQLLKTGRAFRNLGKRDARRPSTASWADHAARRLRSRVGRRRAPARDDCRTWCVGHHARSAIGREHTRGAPARDASADVWATAVSGTWRSGTPDASHSGG